MIWAPLIPAPVKRALAWLLAGLAAFWAIRAGAKREARAETALEAAERYAKTRKAIDDAETVGNVPAILRDCLSERGQR